MSTLSTQIAQGALRRQMRPRNTASPSLRAYNSHTAEKFILRTTPELLKELDDLALRSERSRNSELVVAVFEDGEGRCRDVLINALTAYLGAESAGQVLSDMAEFVLGEGPWTEQYVMRLPAHGRDAITRWVGSSPIKQPINSWMNAKVASWINFNRRYHALLTACANRP